MTCPMDYLRISGGSLNGTALSAQAKSVGVAAGQALSGSIQAELYRAGCSSCVTVFGVTPSWGAPQSSHSCAPSFTGTGIFTKSVTISTTAPSAPGTYYLILARGLEFTCNQVFSATNWQVGAGTWGDGNDVAGWSAEPWRIELARDRGVTCASWLTTAGFTPTWIPADAVQVLVN